MSHLDARQSERLSAAERAHDQWQVVDRLDQLELGGAVNLARHRDMALSGGAILERLAAGAGQEAADAGDDDLAQACEQWLAVTATDDSRVQAQSQPAVVDLSRSISRYIGETEKHHDSLFAQAQPSRVLLRFDEADALFGKRSDVKDSHDR